MPAQLDQPNNHELTRNFERWAVQQNLSPASVRNYVSDVNGFFEWLANLPLPQRQFTPQILHQYRQHLLKAQKPLNSANRVLSSLRKFGQFLVEANLTDQDPAEGLKNIIQEELTTPPPKQSLTEQFAQSLVTEQLAPATIKNYVSDVNQFFAWLVQYEQGVDLQGFTPQLITQFRRYLWTDLQIVPASIERKISSLRRFFTWAKQEGLITQNPLAGEEKKPKLPSFLMGDRWIAQEKPQLPEESFWEKLKQRWQILTLTGISLLLLLLLLLFRPWQYLPEIGIQEISTRPGRQLVIPTPSPQAVITTLAGNPWIVTFRGKLTSAVTNQPLNQPATVIFTLYSSESDVTPLWTSKEWELAPDQNGNFYAPLGDATRGDTEIPSRIFFLHDNLFLAANVNGEELKPRARISTAANAANAYLLEQHPPQEETDIGGIPVIDKAGALTLAAPSPKIKALNDTFAIEGQAITLTTPFASDGSITLKPDGAGSVKVLGSNPTGNTLSVTNANLITGALLSANLGSSLTTPYLLSLSAGASPSAKFTVDAAGNMVLSGSVKGQTELTLADSRASALFSDTSNTTLPGGAKSILGALKLAYDKTATSSTTTTSPWTDGGDYLYPTNRESVRIYDSAGTDYLQLAHSGTALNFTAVNTSDLSIYLPIVLRDTATFERRAIFSDLVRFYNTSSDPTNIGEGSLYYNTTNDLLRVYTGAGWIDVGSSLWTDGGTTTYLTSTSDDLALGGTGSTAPFFMDVSTGNLSITGDLDVNGNDITSASNLTINPDGTADIYFHSSSYQISDTGDITLGGRVTFENSEFIDNETDGSLILNDSGGNTLTFDLDGTHPTLSSSTTALGLDDDLRFIGAQTITTSTGNLTIDTAGTLVISDVTDLDVNSTTAFTVGDGSANTLTVNTTGDLVTVTGNLTVGDGVIANAFGLLTVNRAATISALIASDDPLTLKNASGNRVFDIDSTGLITLANSETVSNSSNGSIVLADSGGNTFTFDLDATNPTLESSTTQIAINDNLALANDKVIALGGVSPLAYQAIANSGGAASAATVGADNDLYVQGTIEASELCLGADCQTTWSAISGNWEFNNNALHPKQEYASVADVLVGSTATVSARVRLPGLNNQDAFFNLGTGNVGIGTTTPTAKLDIVGDASTSGSLVFRGSNPATIDILNGRRLDLQTSDGGDLGLTPVVSILNNGNLGIGTTTPGTKLQVAGSITSTTANADDLGSTTLEWNSLYLADGSGLTAGGGLFFGSDQDFLLTYDAATSNALELSDGTDTFLSVADAGSTATFAFNTNDLYIKSDGNVGIGTTTPAASLEIGNRVIGDGLGLLQVNRAATISALIATDDPLTLKDEGGNRVFDIDSNGLVTLLNSETIGNAVNGSIVFTDSGGNTLTFDLDGTHPTLESSTTQVNINDALGIEGYLSDITDTTLTIDDDLALTNGNVLAIGGIAAQNYNAFSDAGTSNRGLASDNDLYIEGDLEVDSIGYFDNQICLQGDCISAWSAAGAESLWQNSSNAFHPKDAYASVVDLLVGGTASTSAVFQVTTLGVNAGNASVSGNLVLRDGGSLVTTNDASLTLGDGDTGRVVIDPGSDYLDIDTGTIDLSTQATSINLIDANAAALSFESGLLRLDTAATAVEVTGTTNLGDGGTTNYASFNATGDLTFNGAADTVTGPGAGGLTVTNTSGQIQLITVDSGELDLTSAGLMDVNAGANLDIDVTGTFDLLSTSTFSIDGTGNSNVSATSGNLTLSTITSGYLDLISAQAAGQTTTEAISLSATNDLGAADEVLQISDGGGDLFTIMGDGNVGVGTITPTAKLDLVGDASTSGSLVFRGATPATIDILNGARLDFQTSDGGDLGLAPVVSLLNNGNVGVGTTTPNGRLDLVGSQNFSTFSAPGALTAGTPTAGGSCTPGTHSYKVTFTSVGQGETTAGTVSNQITCVLTTGQTVPLSGIPIGPAGTTGRKIYRTVAGDTGSYLLVTTINDNTTTIYSDTTADGSLGAAAPSSNTTAVANLQTGGTTKMVIDSTGNVGIGATTPRAKLDVAGDASVSGSLVFRGATPATIDILNGARLDFQTSDGGDLGLGQAMSILNNGNVGIGTTTPSEKLEVAGKIELANNFLAGGITGVNYNALSDSNTSSRGLASDNDLYIEGDLEVDSIGYFDNQICLQGDCINSWSGGGTGLWQNNANAFHPREAYASVVDVLVGSTATASARVRLPGLNNQHAFFNLGTGNVGIGTTTPLAKLQVVGGGILIDNNVALQAKDTGGTARNLAMLADDDIAYYRGRGDGAEIRVDEPNNKIILADTDLGTQEIMTVDTANALVGIGTTTPSAKLDIVGDLEVNGYATVSSSLAVGYATAPAGPGNAAFSGNLGIGTTTPSQKLDVVGDAEIANYLYFGNGSSEYLRWDTSDFILTDDLLPDTADANNLGSTAAEWSSLYLADATGAAAGGGLFFGSDQDFLLTYDAATSNALELSDGTNTFLSMADAGSAADFAFNADDLFIDDGGNVGVGTTSPAYPLHVIGLVKDPDLKSEVYHLDGEFSYLQGAQDVYVSGNYAYVASNTSSSLTIIDISNPTNPALKSEVRDADGEFNRLQGASGVFVSGKYAYVASPGDRSLTIMDISDPTDPVLKSEVYNGDGEFSRLTGAVDVYVSGNYAYVASNQTNGNSLTIIDISDPTDPVLKSEVYDADGEFNRLDGAQSVFVSGDYAYVAAYDDHALTIMDVTDPTNPVLMSEVYDADGEFNQLQAASSVFVSGNYAYVTSYANSALTIMDISDPTNPALKSEVYDADGEFSRLNGAYTVFVAGDYAYVTSLLDASLTIMDISDPTNPALKSEVYDADGEFSRLNGAMSVFVSGNYAYVASQYDNSFTTIDVSGGQISNLATGAFKSGSLQVMDNALFDNDVFITGSLTAIDAFFSGDVGIYNDGAQTALTVKQDGTGDLFNLFDNSTEVFTVINGGNVGIGITDPVTKLDINSGSNTTALRLRGLAETAEIADMFLGTVGELIISTVNGTDTGGYINLRPEDNEYGLMLSESDGTGTATYANFYVTDSGSVDYLTLNVNSITDGDALVITEQNRIGIGTTTPSSKLHLVGDYTGGWLATFNNTSTNALTADGLLIQVNRDGATALKVASGSANLLSVSTALLQADVPASFSAQGDVSIANDLWFTDLSANYIKSDGNLYIEAGDANSAENLYLRSAGTGDVVVGSGTTYFKNNGDVDFQYAGTSRMFVDADTGYVGIGLTNPGAKLMLADANYVGNYMWGDSDNSGAEKRAWIAFGQSGTVAAPSISWATGIKTTGEYAITRRTSAWADPGDTPSFLIDANGQVGIGTSAPAAQLQLTSNLAINSSVIPSNATNISAGSSSVDYQANSGWPATWNSNILLSGSDYTSIAFHDSGIALGALTYHANLFAFDGAGSWGPVSLGINTRTPDSALDVAAGAVKTGSGYAVGTRAGNNMRIETGSNSTSCANNAWVGIGFSWSTAFSATPTCTNVAGFGGNYGNNQRSNASCTTTGTQLNVQQSSGSTQTCYGTFLGFGQTAMTDFDLAESYKTKDLSIESGDVVCVDPNNNSHIVKCSSPYDPTAIGIISTEPGLVIGDDLEPTSRLVGLQGRVPVKVSLENGPIKRGDLLTPSATKPGYAMKATKPGQIIGKALQPFDGTATVFGENAFDGLGKDHLEELMAEIRKTGEGQTMAFINISWSDPDVYLTNKGEIQLHSQTYDGKLADASTNTLKAKSYQLTAIGGQVIDRIGAFKDVVVGGVRAALVETQNLIADTAVIRQVKVEEKLVSPVVETNQLLVNGQDVGSQINNLQADVSALNTNYQILNTNGKATFGDLLVEGDATVGGKLTANKLVLGHPDPDISSGEGSSEASNTASGLDSSSSPQNDMVLEVNGSATISGDLYANSARFQKLRAAEITADRIKVESIEGLDAKIANILASTVAAEQVNTYAYQDQEASPSGAFDYESWEEELDTLLARMDSWDEATVSGSWTAQNLNTNPPAGEAGYQILTTGSLDADLGTFNTHLAVLGQATITNLEVTASLNVANNLQFTSNSISVLGCSPAPGAGGFFDPGSSGSCDNTLYLQPSGLGKLDFLAGALTIDDQGDVHIKGDVYIAGRTTTKELAVAQSATVSGSLFANLIRPINGRLDVILNASGSAGLDSSSSPQNDKLRIANQFGKEVASVDASGSARFNKLLIAGASEASPSGTGFAQLFETRVKSSATAGTATLKASQTDLIIENPQLTDKSLVYVTPTSDTKNQVLYVKAKASCQLPVASCQPYFVVSINQPLTKDVKFNWWIIN